MIKHIVMWQFKEYAQGKTKQENLEWAKAQLEALPKVIPCLKKMEVHLNCNDKPGMYDAVLESEFNSLDDLFTYRKHPDHKMISEYITRALPQRHSAIYSEIIL